jgi:hypothetical protein
MDFIGLVVPGASVVPAWVDDRTGNFEVLISGRFFG